MGTVKGPRLTDQVKPAETIGLLGKLRAGSFSALTFLVRWVSAPHPASLLPAFPKPSSQAGLSEGYKHKRAHSALFTTRRLSVQIAGQYY